MTDKKDCMTMEQAEQKMECLREVFSIVRLVDGEMLEKRAEHSADADVMEMCQCYSFWNKAKPCENCISMKSLREKKQAAKLEFLDSDIFQVFSRYVEIDGKPYVMEMLKKLDEDTLIDAVGYGKMVQKLSVYNDKLYRDALTGAYNRRYYEDEIKHVKGKAGVAILDVDDFKLYNDMRGHHAGDMALITVVEVIRQYIRKTDKLIRYGGDEFLLLLPEIDSENFARKLNKIKKKIAETSVPGYERIKLSVSIGGVSATEETVEEAVQRADKRMYLAKMYKNTAMVEGMDQKIAEEDHDEHTDILKPRILIVDDSKINRELLTEILQDKYQIIEAENGNECVEKLEKYGNDIALILLDIVMPKMDGFQVLTVMNERRLLEDIPVIMISSEDSGKYISEAYGFGVSDYIRRPFDARVVYQRVLNTIKLYSKQRRQLRLVTSQIREKERSNRIMIGILSQIVEFRNSESGPHVIHLNIVSRLLLEQLIKKKNKYHLSWQEIGLIATASALHDIGKINIDEKILNKPGKLTKEEFEIMKTHTTIGATMIGKIDLYYSERLVQLAYEICRWHHERWDGKGYPDGLKGDEIPISAQVVSVADVYDALVSERVYKKAYPHEVAIQMILNGECGNFNPLILECMLDIQDEIRRKISVTSTEDFVRDADAQENMDIANMQLNPLMME